MVASAGVLSHSGIKIPFFTFFAHDSGKRPAEAPTHMLWAMGITAGLCIGIGVFPGLLYALLPYDVDYKPYTVSHILAQMQLLCFALLAFAWLMKSGIHPPEVRGINLDTDWSYRHAIPSVLPSVSAGVVGAVVRYHDFFCRASSGCSGLPENSVSESWFVGSRVEY